ncbi:hypothetical protein Gogos_016803, partial [Gossypium gossypioides]|nr:hypothetical protein [Gossypium gossypioides]
KFQGPHRIRFFIWLALKQRLLRNAERGRRGFGSSSACGLCGHDYEDVLHILRNCNAARCIWVKLIPQISSHKARSHLHNWPLPNSWVSLNTDGSVRFDEGFAADGGCVRDHNGEWIIGFAKYLGNCTVLEAEL